VSFLAFGNSRRSSAEPSAAASVVDLHQQKPASHLRAAPDGPFPQTPLDKYVAAEDAAFEWELNERRDAGDATYLFVDLTSQAWPKRELWTHRVDVIVPKRPTSDVALLVIDGGSADEASPAPREPNERALAIAQKTGSIVARIDRVPYQPLEIGGDGVMREEDDLLARSMVEFMKTFNPNAICHLAMTKSVVRAMDSVQAVLAEQDLPPANRFVVTGGSKRGWTAWLTAAVDDRVVGVAPVVIDLLNVTESMKNHHAAYGFWAPALGDYEGQGLTRLITNPLAKPIFGIVDPYAYRDRLSIPKCIINSSGDQFFTPDSSKFYFDDLKGEKLLCYVPNADHSLRDTTALDTLIAFHATVATGRPRPEVSWRLAEGGAWEVECRPTPKRALLWQATNPKARDFRFQSIGAAYKSRPVAPDAAGRVVAAPQAVGKGYTAYFVELEFDVGAATPLRVTTPVNILPDELPFAE
jgi:PhoPQ-activated pathogenicity-related protein